MISTMGSPAESTLSLSTPATSVSPSAQTFSFSKDSIVRRYLRSLYDPSTPQTLPPSAMTNAEEIIKVSGAEQHSDVKTLCHILFSLSATNLPLVEEDHQNYSCGECSELGCFQGECQRNKSTEIGPLDRQTIYDSEGNSNLHRAVQHGRKVYVNKLLRCGLDPWQANIKGMNPAVYGWGFTEKHKDDPEKYMDIWVCMIRVMEKQREISGVAVIRDDEDAMDLEDD